MDSMCLLYPLGAAKLAALRLCSTSKQNVIVSLVIQQQRTIDWGFIH